MGSRAGGALGETPCIPKHCSYPLTASQLVTMHDLKQGLGPSGTAGARKSTSNKYKLKVGVPWTQGEQLLAWLREEWRVQRGPSLM